MSMNISEEKQNLKIIQYHPAKASVTMRFWTLDFIVIPFCLILGVGLQFKADSLTNLGQVLEYSYLLQIIIGVVLSIALYLLFLLFYRNKSLQHSRQAPYLIRPPGIGLLGSLSVITYIFSLILPSYLFNLSITSLIWYLIAICYFSLSHELKQGFLEVVFAVDTKKDISIKYVHPYIGWNISIVHHLTTAIVPEFLIKYNKGRFANPMSMYLSEDQFNTMIQTNTNNSDRFDLYVHVNDISDPNKTNFLVLSMLKISEINKISTSIKRLFGEFKVIIPVENIALTNIYTWYFI